MENESNKPKKGTWNSLGMTDTQRPGRITFEINLPVNVTFKTDEPIELEDMGDDAKAETVYYEFAVEESGQPKIIQTSAWTLLRELKKLSPLMNKKTIITKKIDKGKQYFEVKHIQF